MKYINHFKNKKLMIALASVVGFAGLMIAPVSQAFWVRWHTGPRFVRPARVAYTHRHVWVHRSCYAGRCYVRRRVWYTR